MNLLEEVKKLPTFDGPKQRKKWADFVAPYHHLIRQGYPKAEACRILAELSNLNEEEAGKLYRASKSWRKPQPNQ